MLFVQYVTLVKYAKVIYSSSIIIFYHQWMRLPSFIIHYFLMLIINSYIHHDIRSITYKIMYLDVYEYYAKVSYVSSIIR